MKLSDDNVKELFAQLDPEHTGFINYQKCVNLIVHCLNFIEL